MIDRYPIDISSRIELLVDRYLIAQLSGGAELRLNKPVPREVVLTTDRPWEGNASGQFRVFQNGDRYRMYYQGRHFVTTETGLDETPRPPVVCYAESSDGIEWFRPDLVWLNSRAREITTSS